MGMLVEGAVTFYIGLHHYASIASEQKLCLCAESGCRLDIFARCCPIGQSACGCIP